MKQHIYADNAATTRLDTAAFEAMKPFLTDEYGNASQPYSFARVPKNAISEARRTIASCVGALPEEIYFTCGGTESNNWTIKGSALVVGEKCEILTSTIEHHAVLNACATIKQLGCPVTYLPVTRDGTVLPETLRTHITGKTRLVSVMLANNEIGTVQPIKELCAITHENGALFHTDAVQAVGHILLNVHELGVDMLSASAHKFNGPKGIGFLYVRKGVKLPSYMDGGSQEFGLRAGTENVAGIVGMAIALRNNCEKMTDNIEHISTLEELLLEKLDEKGIRFLRNGGRNTLPGLLSLSFPGYDGEMLLHRLDLGGICVSTGSACDGNNAELSHVLKAIHLEEKYARGTIRISLGKYNTSDDVGAICTAISKICSKNK